MPIVINKEITTKNANKKAADITPKLIFDSKLNGNLNGIGRKNGGRMHAAMNPADYTKPVDVLRTYVSHPQANKALKNAGTTKRYYYPIFPIRPHMLNSVSHLVTAPHHVGKVAAPKLPLAPHSDYVLDITPLLSDKVQKVLSTSAIAHNRILVSIAPDVFATTMTKGNDPKDKEQWESDIEWRVNVALTDEAHYEHIVDISDDSVINPENGEEEFLNEIILGEPQLDLPFITYDVEKGVPSSLPNMDFMRNTKCFTISTLAESNTCVSVVENAVQMLLAHSWLENAAPQDAADALRDSMFTEQGRTDFLEWMREEFNIYDIMTSYAKVWASDRLATDYLNPILDVAFDIFGRMGTKGLPMSSFDIGTHTAETLRTLDYYPVNLSTYSLLFDNLNKLPARIEHEYGTNVYKVKDILIKQNMQLTLNGHLSTLKSIRNDLPTANVHSNVESRLSTEQRAAVTTTSPMSIVQAGAGTGKSSTILSRMQYLIDGGTKPENITVLSFTNAAADNITQKNEKVVSKTIARMIMEVYENNFPTQKLSTTETLINTMEAIYGEQVNTVQFMAQFHGLLRNIVRKSENSDMTALSEFISNYPKQVIEVLNVLQQTTLELQIILAYHLVDTLDEPFASPEHIIIDEVQDNSIFEFIYMLRYAIKHKAALYLVGDSSQTLYEFRSANPKALNALEGSGAFDCYRLTTNYRSTQDILSFANLTLATIEANQFANIQLRSNILSEPNLKSFTETIKVEKIEIPNTYGTVNAIPSALLRVKDDIDKHLGNDEKVAVLCRTNKEVAAVIESLHKMYPQEKVANLVGERKYPTTIFSQFIAKFWASVEAVDPPNAAFVFTQEIKKSAHMLFSHNANLTQEKARDIVTDHVVEWWSQNKALVNVHLASVSNNRMSNEEFFYELKQSILNYEISKNSIRQRVIRDKNKEQKKINEDARLAVSTIHSAKGLEFDNTIIIRKPDPNNGLGEDEKRSLYVALTRAKKTETILCFTPPKHASLLLLDYNNLLKEIETAEQQKNAQPSTVSP